MTPTSEISELLARWRAARQGGQILTPEELCAGSPECLVELRARIAALEADLDAPAASPPTELQTISHSDAAAPPLAVAGRYRAAELHARGGLGEVLLAEDTELHRPVALKRIRERRADDADSRRRFLREAEITARLQHPGIVPVYGLTQDEHGRPCYAMRFIEGRSLHRAIKEMHGTASSAPSDDAAAQRPKEIDYASLEFRHLLQTLIAVCNTMAYAHSRGIIHRDLKPPNIMLGRFGETLVVDWGLARRFDRTDAERATGEETLTPSEPNDDSATQTGQAVGTPGFMSPEQAAGDWDAIAPVSDVFSLGAILYQILTGRSPYPGRSPLALDKALRCEFPRPRQLVPAIPPALEAICLKALAKEPANRYGSATALADDLERWLADEPVTAWREPWTERARRWRKRHRALVAGITALVATTALAATIGAAMLSRANSDIRQQAQIAAQNADEAHQQRVEADRQRAAAQRNAADARDAVDRYFTRVAQHRLLNEPGMQPLRRDLLRDAVDIYRRLAHDQRQESVITPRLAQTHMRLAQILSELGERQDAIDESLRARAIYEKIAASDPGDRQADAGIADCDFQLSLLWAVSNEPEKARDAQQRVQERVARLGGEQVKMARAHALKGAILNQSGDYAGARAELASAVTLFEELSRENPTVLDYRQHIAITRTSLAMVLGRLSAEADAEACYLAAHEIWQDLATRHPISIEYQKGLGFSLLAVGNFYRDIGRHMDGVVWLSKAGAQSRRLLDANPTMFDLQYAVGWSYLSLGQALAALGRTSEAADAFQIAADTRARMMLEHGLATGVAEDLLKACHGLRENGRAQAGLDCYSKLIRSLESNLQLVTQDDRAKKLLNQAHYDRAMLAISADNYAEALTDWNRIVELGVLSSDLARSNRSTALAYLGEFDRAIADIHAVLELPNVSADALYNLACSHAVIAALAPKVKDRSEAERAELINRHGDAAIALLRQAVAKGFRNAQHMRSDSDLTSLRARADFQNLLAELEKPSPP